MALKEIIILVALFSVGIASECPTCQAGYCDGGGISEPCPGDIHLCYVLTVQTNSSIVVIRAGCLFQNCTAIEQHNPGSKCQECYGDNCNWPSNQLGNNSSNSLASMISFLSVVISVFVLLL
uniref:Uncharacterized protein n=1 Tax=Acrobeloides nanus TaxID=290746 RepID=A0A914DQF6_9BILA